MRRKKVILGWPGRRCELPATIPEPRGSGQPAEACGLRGSRQPNGSLRRSGRRTFPAHLASRGARSLPEAQSEGLPGLRTRAPIPDRKTSFDRNLGARRGKMVASSLRWKGRGRCGHCLATAERNPQRPLPFSTLAAKWQGLSRDLAAKRLHMKKAPLKKRGRSDGWWPTFFYPRRFLHGVERGAVLFSTMLSCYHNPHRLQGQNACKE